MKDCDLIDIIDWIDWDHIIMKLSLHEGVSITTDPNRWNWDTTGYSDIFNMWEEANFNKSAIKWINYYPSEHYPQLVVDKIATWLNVIPIRSWISKIEPGYFAPLHWDVDDNESTYLKTGNIIRFSCFIDNPKFGHIFALGEDYLFSQKKGALYRWKNHREWHSGINAGMSDKYMFHLLAHNK